jgi:hypothetical protein
MMPGSSSGKYFPFARKGDVLLGIQPQGIAPGQMYGVPGTTYFAARLRSAPENGLFAEEDAAQKVVQFVKQPENLWDAWPSVTWEKKDETRASTAVGMFVKGQFGGDHDTLQKLLDQVGDGKLTKKLAAYLIELAGKENLIVDPNELVLWLEGKFKPSIDKIVDSLEKQKKVAEILSDSVGSFGMQAAQLKSVYEKKTPEVGYDESENGEEEGEEG